MNVRLNDGVVSTQPKAALVNFGSIETVVVLTLGD